MKRIKDKYLVVGADFAGYPLKEAVGRAPEREGMEDHGPWELRAKAIPPIRKICFTA